MTVDIPILIFPDQNQPCLLFTDDSNNCWSGLLTQERETDIKDNIIKSFLPITYISCT